MNTPELPGPRTNQPRATVAGDATLGFQEEAPSPEAGLLAEFCALFEAAREPNELARPAP